MADTGRHGTAPTNRHRPDDAEPPDFEFCMPGRPVSAQAASRLLLQDWKDRVRMVAGAAWTRARPFHGDVELRVSTVPEAVRVATGKDLSGMAWIYLVNIIVQAVRELARRNGVSHESKADGRVVAELGFRGVLPGDLVEQCLAVLNARDSMAYVPEGTSDPLTDDTRQLLELRDAVRDLLQSCFNGGRGGQAPDLARHTPLVPAPRQEAGWVTHGCIATPPVLAHNRPVGSHGGEDAEEWMDTLLVRVAHRMVDDWHVFTSTDVPELYSGNVSRDVAWQAIPSAVAMIRHVRKLPPVHVSVVELEHA